MSDTHECPAPGCGRQVPFERFACTQHWFSLPAELRERLLFEYRRNFGEWSYLDARAACVAYLEG